MSELKLRPPKKAFMRWLLAAGGLALARDRRGGFHRMNFFVPLVTQTVALPLSEAEPGFGEIADALECGLHFGLLRFQRVAVRVGGDADRRRDEHHGAGKRIGDLKEVPGFLERMRALDPDVKHGNGMAAAAREDHGAGFGDVARPARTVDRECDMATSFEMPRHRREPLDRAA